jgi:hypothetical protein
MSNGLQWQWSTSCPYQQQKMSTIVVFIKHDAKSWGIS